MAELLNKDFPEGFYFNYVPYEEEDQQNATSCRIPIQFKLTKENLAGKRIVITSAPGAFTPTCTLTHIPGYIEKASDFKAKKVDKVFVITADSAFVNSAWGKLLGQKPPVEFASDPNARFSKSIGWTIDAGDLGERTARYTIIVDDGKVIYAAKEEAKEVTVSSADVALAKL